ncbi:MULTISPECIES: hypothetical protein [unclassified Streptomyces]|uniref:hypothetical protein n=1 Tax=unclassified Streptomyces TaxID=2593676 RepID=UPI003BB6B59B
MDSELATLAASGATTLVSLMVTDSWTHARELVGRFLSRTGSGDATIDDLDTARAQLLAAETAEGAQGARGTADQWHAHLQRLLQVGSATSEDLRGLLTSLQRLSDGRSTEQLTVHNDISGTVQHGPVIQSGRITGLTFHLPHPADPSQD